MTVVASSVKRAHVPALVERYLGERSLDRFDGMSQYVPQQEQQDADRHAVEEDP